jgi:hypothetical protein
LQITQCVAAQQSEEGWTEKPFLNPDYCANGIVEVRISPHEKNRQHPDFLDWIISLLLAAKTLAAEAATPGFTLVGRESPRAILVLSGQINLRLAEFLGRRPGLMSSSPLGWAVCLAKGATTLQPRATPWELDPNKSSPP